MELSLIHLDGREIRSFVHSRPRTGNRAGRTVLECFVPGKPPAACDDVIDEVASGGTGACAFLRTRRAELNPEQVGLPAVGGRRRVPGLRREGSHSSP